MKHQSERIAVKTRPAAKWLASAAVLVSLISACGQLSGGTARPAGSRSATDAAFADSAAVAKAPQPTSASAQPSAKHADLVGGVSCTGAACTAVGYYYYGTTSENTLVERWAGSSWQLERSPDSVRYSSLSGVSCPTATSCVAVGSPILTWHGASWQISARSSAFSAVSCPTARYCLAVGMAQSGKPVYGTWRGSRWRTALLPAPAQSQTQQVTVTGVSCATAKFCVAVGNYATGVTAQPSPAYRDRTFAEEWNGRSWRALHPANVGPIDAFSAVSCVSPANCTAVGTRAAQYPIAEHWNGTAWRVQHVPLPGTIGYTQLSAVACGSASVCVAVGNYQGRPLAEVIENGTWRLSWLPHPAGDDNQPQAVSCARATTCMAVGVDFDAAATSYADRWNGEHWVLLQMQNPS